MRMGGGGDRDDADPEDPEGEPVPAPSGRHHDPGERENREHERPRRLRRSGEDGRRVGREVDRRADQQHPHPELERSHHGLREQPREPIGDALHREQHQEGRDLQPRRVDHSRGELLRDGHGGERLQGLHRKRDPEEQPRADREKPGAEEHRSRVEVVHEDQRGGEGHEHPEVGDGSGRLPEADREPATPYPRLHGRHCHTAKRMFSTSPS